MEKSYLAGFGHPQRSDTLSNCRGYFTALKDQGVLRGKINSGWIVTRGEEYFDTFCRIFENDVLLWEMLKKKVEKEKSNSLSISVIRAEINETEKGDKLAYALAGLNRNYPPLDFVTYHSDIKDNS